MKPGRSYSSLFSLCGETRTRARPMARTPGPAMIRMLPGSSSPCAVLWALVVFFLTVYLYTLSRHRNELDRIIQMRTNRISLYRELQRVDEEVIPVPSPKGKRSPRAVKRRPKRAFSLVDEFLDESSQVRHLFFPDQRSDVDPRGDLRNDSFYFYPGRVWLDTDGRPIQAHGGGVLYDEKSQKYYWYGENKDGPTYHAHKKGPSRVDVVGVGCYSSKDLWAWQNEGIVLAAEQTNETHDLHKSKVVERPKVIYNEMTRKYVMWMHIDDANYTKASVGVAVSDSPTGPFHYLHTRRPHGFESRDMTMFKDDDGIAYIIYSSEGNSELHVGPLTSDFLDLTDIVNRVFIGQHREAPAVFKYERTYYMITSGCTGWAPNEALAHAADSVMGPWEILGNPCVGGNKEYRLATFFAQGTFVLPLAGLPGVFVFMADRWNPGNLKDSRYVWLPLVVNGGMDLVLEHDFGVPLWPRVSIYWHRSWALPKGWKGSL